MLSGISACKQKAIECDSNPSPETTIRNREATRLVSTAMQSSGSWLNVVLDNTTRNEFKSMHFEVAVQRRAPGISHRAGWACDRGCSCSGAG
jgi:hypothetical protein